MVPVGTEDREAVEGEIATGQAHKTEAAVGVEGSLKLYKISFMIYLSGSLNLKRAKTYNTN